MRDDDRRQSPPKRELLGLMPKQTAGDQRAGPAAHSRQGEQGAFRNARRSPLGAAFIRPKGAEAGRARGERHRVVEKLQRRQFQPPHGKARRGEDQPQPRRPSDRTPPIKARSTTVGGVVRSRRSRFQHIDDCNAKATPRPIASPDCVGSRRSLSLAALSFVAYTTNLPRSRPT
jgi:hypothetical protein